MGMKKEIENEGDIQFLVDAFYKKAIVDETIGYFFTDIIKINWQTHLPIICSFWYSVLFGTTSYKGNPMLKHIELNKKEPLHKEHFTKWLQLWEETIDAYFVGKKAEEAKKKAIAMSQLMMYKIEASKQNGFIQ